MEEFNDVRFNSGREELYSAVKNSIEINIYNAVIKTFVKFPSFTLDHEILAKSLASEAVLRLQQQLEI